MDTDPDLQDFIMDYAKGWQGITMSEIALTWMSDSDVWLKTKMRSDGGDLWKE